MLKFILVVLASFMVCFFAVGCVGSRMAATAFHMPVLGWGISWLFCLFCGLCVCGWKVVTSK